MERKGKKKPKEKEEKRGRKGNEERENKSSSFERHSLLGEETLAKVSTKKIQIFIRKMLGVFPIVFFWVLLDLRKT